MQLSVTRQALCCQLVIVALFNLSEKLNIITDMNQGTYIETIMDYLPALIFSNLPLYIRHSLPVILILGSNFTILIVC